MRASIILIVSAVLIAAGAAALPAAGNGGEDLKAAIDHLLAFVRASDVVFIRNGKEHSSEDAADHIKKKYEHHRKKIETPEDFIRLSATKSMMSGKPYTVRLPDGSIITTKEWLEAELARYRAARASSPDSTGDSTACAQDSSRG
jgi:hypothetical protein